MLLQMLLKGLEHAEDRRRETVHEAEVLLLQSVYWVLHCSIGLTICGVMQAAAEYSKQAALSKLDRDSEQQALDAQLFQQREHQRGRQRLAAQERQPWHCHIYTAQALLYTAQALLYTVSDGIVGWTGCNRKKKHTTDSGVSGSPTKHRQSWIGQSIKISCKH